MSEITLFDFEDGNGPVEATQHPKGGGWVAKTAIVDPDCFIGPEARVFGNACVLHRAKVNDFAKVFGDAKVSDDARVYGNSLIFENAKVHGYARVTGNAKIYGNAIIRDNAQVFDNAEVFDHAKVRNNSEVYDEARVYGNGDLYDCAKIYGNSIVTRRPIIVTGFDYPVAFTDHHICIGCVVFAPRAIERYGVRIMTAKGYSVEDAKKWKEAILTVSKLHGVLDREEDMDEGMIFRTIDHFVREI